MTQHDQGYSYTASIELFARCLGLLYVAAFASLYVQLPGLYQADGLEPVGVYLRKQRDEILDPHPSSWDLWQLFKSLPTLLWLHKALGLSVDVALEVVSLLGILAGGCLAAGWVCAPVAAVAWASYLSLLNVGQTFLSFQWDIMLVEVGWATIWLLPLMLHYFQRVSSTTRRAPAPAALLLVRWILFKLMLQAGAVKVQARCPTWLQLTACHYHMATQCIPGALSWWAHQLPDGLLRAMVAGTFVIELPATLLLLAPARPLRLLGAALQVQLQASIILTGHYNFFNALTALMCLTLVDDGALARLLPARLLSALILTAPAPAAVDGSTDQAYAKQQEGPSKGLAGASKDSEELSERRDGNRAVASAASAGNTAAATSGTTVAATAGTLAQAASAHPRQHAQPGAGGLAGVVQQAYYFPDRVWGMMDASPGLTALLLGIMPLVAAGWAMLGLEKPSGQTVRGAEAGIGSGGPLVLSMTPNQLDRMLRVGLPWVVGAWGAVLLGTAALDVIRACAQVASCIAGPNRKAAPGAPDLATPLAGAAALKPSRWGRSARGAATRTLRSVAAIVHVAWVTLCAGAVVATFVVGLPSSFSISQEAGAVLMGRHTAAVTQLHRSLWQWHFASSYGLFKRMTGVGYEAGGGALVARPELELLGSDDGQAWAAVRFIAKVGDLATPPPAIIAPHQPRLDWQMWFAALGSWRGNPWLLHLLLKLMQGSPAVRQLLHPASPWTAPGSPPPKLMRAELWHYDFTRAPWSRPRQHINASSNSHSNAPVDYWDGYAQSGQVNVSGLWWERVHVSNYLSTISADMLQPIIYNQLGWDPARSRALGAKGNKCSSRPHAGTRIVCKALKAAVEHAPLKAWARSRHVQAVWAAVGAAWLGWLLSVVLWRMVARRVQQPVGTARGAKQKTE